MKEIFVAQFRFYMQGFPERSENVNFSTWDGAELEYMMLQLSFLELWGKSL